MLLSICIPCYKRASEVRNTLKSIYIDNSEIPLDAYEVVISDNDPEAEIRSVVAEFPYPNLKYYKTTCEGFMNSYYALTYGKGEFLKLHNSQSQFRTGAIKTLIGDIEKAYKSKGHIFYTNGMLNRNQTLEFDNYDSFMSTLSYWSSWSNGFCIWKEQFERIQNIKLNKLFPHTSLFLAQSQVSQYIINDIPLFDIQRIPKRGGHNKFAAFSLEYPSLIDEQWRNERINKHTKDIIFRGLMVEMLPTLIFNKYIARIECFESYGYYQNIKRYFPWYAYWLSYILSPFVPIKKIYNRILKWQFLSH